VRSGYSALGQLRPHAHGRAAPEHRPCLGRVVLKQEPTGEDDRSPQARNKLAVARRRGRAARDHRDLEVIAVATAWRADLKQALWPRVQIPILASGAPSTTALLSLTSVPAPTAVAWFNCSAVPRPALLPTNVLSEPVLFAFASLAGSSGISSMAKLALRRTRSSSTRSSALLA
jgi:hypothetical protein